MVLVANEVASELASHPAASWARIPEARLPTQLLRNQVLAWRSFCWLRRHAHQLDVVHVNGFNTWASSDVNTAHFVHSAWLRSPMHTARLRRDFYGVYQGLFTALNACLERRAYRRTKVVVAVSEKIRNELVGIGVPANRLCIITNGVDLAEFSPGCTDRGELGLPEGVLLALFVGDIRVPRKNLDTVLHALVEVPGLHLAVAGSTEGSPYPHLAKQLGLSSRVHFLGYRQGTSELMRAADLFVFPSRYEAAPLVLLEAMASGLPVIATVTAGAAGLVNAECGTVLDKPNDTNALTLTLKEMIQCPERRKRMGRAARVAAEQHSWRRMSESYLRLYEEIAGHERTQDEGVFYR